MKHLVILLLAFVTSAAYGIIDKGSEEHLDRDLSYKMTEEPTSDKRKVASAENEVSEEVENLEEQDREIANDGDEMPSESIQYWEY